MFRYFLSSLILLIPTLSCAANLEPIDPVRALNYEATDADRQLVEEAAGTVNGILGIRSGFRLFGTWQTPPKDIPDSNLIRIYLVAPKDGDNFNLMVPFDCGCVFLQPQVFRSSFSGYVGEEQMLQVDEKFALAFMLLHEVGHIAHHDYASYDDVHKTHIYNLDDTAQKKRESSADEFAARTLVVAANNKRDFKGWASALDVEMTLTKLSWNLSVIRELHNFGATPLCSKFVFADDGMTHPNYELRILVVSDIILHTPTSRDLLKAFEACRTSAPRPPLFRQ